MIFLYSFDVFLLGFMNSTSGTATVEGFDIGTDMETLYGLMGVCPQHNLLWETLTGHTFPENIKNQHIFVQVMNICCFMED